MVGAPSKQLLAGSRLHGTQITALKANLDQRGIFTEVFRSNWGLCIDPVQWSLVTSHQRVLRGMHLHLRHDECISVVQGRALVGLYDIRPNSPTSGQSSLIELRGDEPCVVSFPRGIVHGWYFSEQTIHLQAVSENYSEYHDDDNLGCHWADPDLHIPWPDADPLISARSTGFASLAELRIAASITPSSQLRKAG